MLKAHAAEQPRADDGKGCSLLIGLQLVLVVGDWEVGGSSLASQQHQGSVIDPGCLHLAGVQAQVHVLAASQPDAHFPAPWQRMEVYVALRLRSVKRKERITLSKGCCASSSGQCFGLIV